MIEDAIRARVCPGAVVLVTREGIVRKKAAYGHAVLYRDFKEQRPDPIPTTTTTIFDLASLTKVVATTTPDLTFPACATIVQRKLGAANTSAQMAKGQSGKR